MSMSVNTLMSNYTYGYGTGMGIRPKLDKDSDSFWSKTEITNYADAYTKATGEKLDVDKLMADYDKDSDGKINFSEQEAVRKDDALNLKSLKPDSVASSAASGTSTSSSTQKTTSEILSDLMANMSTSAKVSLSSMIYKSEQKSNLFNMFSSSNPMMDFASMAGLSNKGGSTPNWSSYIGQMMNMIV